MQINDLFGAAAAFETVRMPDGTEAAIPTEHAAVIYVNEQPAFRVVCTPQLLPQLALGRLLTEGWIASAEEVEQISVCAEGLKVNIYLNHPLTSRRAAAQEVSSCCTDNVALGSPVEVQPLRTVPHLDVQPEWVDALAAAMSAGLPLYQATHAVHSCFVLHEGRILCACEDIGRHNALDKAVGSMLLAGVPSANACSTPAAAYRWIWCAKPSGPAFRHWSARPCPPSSRWSWPQNTACNSCAAGNIP